KRQIVMAFYSGMLLCYTAMALGKVFPVLWWLLLIGFPIAFVALLCGMTFYIRCPRCGVPWGQFAFQAGVFGIGRHIRFYPFCGRDIDVEIVEADEWPE